MNNIRNIINKWLSFLKILQQCGASGSGSISTKNYLDVMSASHVEVDKKEMTKFDKMTDDDGFMDKGEFMEYAKKSTAVKEWTDKCVRGKKTSHSVNIDKAEIAFKVTFLLVEALVNPN